MKFYIDTHLLCIGSRDKAKNAVKSAIKAAVIGKLSDVPQEDQEGH